MHELAFPLLVGLVVVALAFDFLNGLHDAANAIATVVATRLLRPVPAVAFAAFFNFAAYFLALQCPALHNVANTVGKGLIDKDLVTPGVVFGALVGAMFWNVVTWIKGLPSSSSHALVGGIIGAGVAHAGLTGVQWTGLNKTLIAIVLSPTLGLMVTMLIMLATSWGGVRASARGAERTLKAMHLCSSGAYCLSHGLNDAQKTMGIIALALASATTAGSLDNLPSWLHFLRIEADPKGQFAIATWIKATCAVVMAMGTMAGGWRIIRTLGHKMVKLHPINGVAADIASSSVIMTASALGIPVSTTHNVSAAIMGVGTAKRANAIKWTVVERMVWAWILTIPIAGALAYLLVRGLKLVGWL